MCNPLCEWWRNRTAQFRANHVLVIAITLNALSGGGRACFLIVVALLEAGRGFEPLISKSVNIRNMKNVCEPSARGFPAFVLLPNVKSRADIVHCVDLDCEWQHIAVGYSFASLYLDSVAIIPTALVGQYYITTFG